MYLAVTRRESTFTIWHTGLTFWPLLVVRFAFTFALAWVSFRVVERPALRLKQRFERRSDSPGAPMVLAPGVTLPQ